MPRRTTHNTLIILAVIVAVTTLCACVGLTIILFASGVFIQQVRHELSPMLPSGTAVDAREETQIDLSAGADPSLKLEDFLLPQSSVVLVCQPSTIASAPIYRSFLSNFMPREVLSDPSAVASLLKQRQMIEDAVSLFSGSINWCLVQLKESDLAWILEFEKTPPPPSLLIAIEFNDGNTLESVLRRAFTWLVPESEWNYQDREILRQAAKVARSHEIQEFANGWRIQALNQTRYLFGSERAFQSFWQTQDERNRALPIKLREPWKHLNTDSQIFVMCGRGSVLWEGVYDLFKDHLPLPDKAEQFFQASSGLQWATLELDAAAQLQLRLTMDMADANKAALVKDIFNPGMDDLFLHMSRAFNEPPFSKQWEDFVLYQFRPDAVSCTNQDSLLSINWSIAFPPEN